MNVQTDNRANNAIIASSQMKRSLYKGKLPTQTHYAKKHIDKSYICRIPDIVNIRCFALTHNNLAFMIK